MVLQAVVDFLDRHLIAGDRMEQILLLVILKNWLECGVVFFHPLVENSFCIILSDNKWFASDIICHLHFWWFVKPVVNAT